MSTLTNNKRMRLEESDIQPKPDTRTTISQTNTITNAEKVAFINIYH